MGKAPGPQRLLLLNPDPSQAARGFFTEGLHLHICDWHVPPRQLGERLVQLVPASGVDVVDLEDEGTCVRFNPLMTAAGMIPNLL